MTRPPPRSTLFPYTTLFRSTSHPPQKSGLYDGRGGHAGAGDWREHRNVQRPERGTAPAASVSVPRADRKSTRLNSSHSQISYAVFCLKKKKHIPSTPFPAAP